MQTCNKPVSPMMQERFCTFTIQTKQSKEEKKDEEAIVF